ncbi:MAG: oligosaccharide flippase family protein [Clostridia bacterium]|nr:oligosaccharide flippase family protein [Clostridia bacterium]
MSRTKNALKNVIWGWTSKLASLVLGFASRTVFIYALGKVFLGVNSLYTEILSMLSLAELGFGTALNFSMYKPVAENDEDKIIKLLCFYRKTYRIIALIVTFLGVALIPFLQHLVKEAEHISILELRVFFVFFLANTVINYFVSYKYSYVNAIQKNYIVTNIDMILNFATIVVQIVVILIAKEYIVYLATHTILILISRIIIALYLNKKFPVLKLKEKKNLEKEEKKNIFKEVKGLVLHQFSSVAVHSTDNMIISALSGMGVVAVGLISNYNLLITSVLGFVTIILSSVTSGFGNLVASSTSENYHKAFKDANFICFWIYGFCSIAFFVLIPPFITLWLGRDFLIDNISFLLIVISQYLLGQSTIYNNARIAKGNFSKDKWISFAQAIVNLVVSIVGAKFLGLVGVYIGTVISRLVAFVFKPVKTYKMLFETSSKDYYKRNLIYFVVTVIVGSITCFASSYILKSVTIWTFVLTLIVVLVIPNVIFCVLFFKTEEFKNVKNRAISILKRRIKK